MFDVAVVGAGMAGLVCAQRLQRMGYQVVVLEKSRGLGGRVATRRLQDTWADHGLRCLEDQGAFSQILIEKLLEQDVIHRWTDVVHTLNGDILNGETLQESDRHPRYGAATGITAIAKFLATSLEIGRGQRVEAIAPTPEQIWALTLEAEKETKSVFAKSLVLAIPAPQILPLLEPFAARMPELWAAVQSVRFDPCITAIATYPPEYYAQLADLPWKALRFSQPSDLASDLAWIGLESSKHLESRQPVIVAQSSAQFADRHLEATDLPSVGRYLLATVQDFLPWLSHPETLQVHRWRYGLVAQPIADFCLGTSQPLPLVCSGDWCGGDQLESALRSGWTAAEQTAILLQNRGMVGGDRSENSADLTFADLLRAILHPHPPTPSP